MYGMLTNSSRGLDSSIVWRLTFHRAPSRKSPRIYAPSSALVAFACFISRGVRTRKSNPALSIGTWRWRHVINNVTLCMHVQHACCSSCSISFRIFLRHILQNTCHLFCFALLFFHSCFFKCFFLWSGLFCCGSRTWYASIALASRPLTSCDCLVYADLTISQSVTTALVSL